MATFGNTNVEDTSTSGWQNYPGACKFTLSETAIIQSITLYVNAGYGDIRLAIYDDDAGDPGALQCETASEATDAGWNTLNTATNPTLSPGTYWLAWHIANDGENIRNKAGTSNQLAYRFHEYGAFPDPFTPEWYADEEYSIYSTYTTTIVGGFTHIF